MGSQCHADASVFAVKSIELEDDAVFDSGEHGAVVAAVGGATADVTEGSIGVEPRDAAGRLRAEELTWCNARVAFDG